MKHLCMHVEMPLQSQSFRNVFLHLQLCTYSTLNTSVYLKIPKLLVPHVGKSEISVLCSFNLQNKGENTYIYRLNQLSSFTEN